MFPSETEIQRAALRLREGGVVAFPTETVYGLGAHALSADACLRIFEIKERPRINPLIVHVPSLEAARPLAAAFPARAEKLAARFWPGPLTLVVPRAECIPDAVTAGLPTVALRVPAHPVAQALLKEAGIPVAAPSANQSNTVSPTTAAHVFQSLAGKVDVILNGGPCEVGLESTIVYVPESGSVRCLRPGGLPIEAIAEALGEPVLLGVGDSSKPLAPGGLAKHYSPSTRLVWRDWLRSPAARTGLLSFRGETTSGFSHVETLSPSGDLREAARGLFAALRRLDGLGLDLLVAERFPEQGLGVAINDRLSRAMA